ncbi:MAG: fibronectin type III domain-containing protein [Myxococcota bacterium]|nr:fibronectin type III domain-containing protein [Myxococcota bacterium]
MLRSKWPLAIGVAIALALSLVETSAAVAQVTRGPYLQSGSHTSITFRWRTAAATASRVRYGTSPTTLTAFVDNPTSTTEHEVRVTGLSPNTTYYYSVGSPTAVQAGGDATTSC